MKKKDKTTNHLNTYLVEFNIKGSTVNRFLINASDSFNALRIGFNRLKRIGYKPDISRARVAEVYRNTTKSICIDTKKGLF